MRTTLLRSVLRPAALTAVSGAWAFAAMPAADQTALVQKYCAICHTDSARNGGLSLEHYDASRRDPQLAAMILSKLHAGAMGAAGIKPPEKPIQEAWISATVAQASGADQWSVVKERGLVSASIVREVAPRKPGGHAPLYRLSLTCSAANNQGRAELTWSPEPQTDRTFTVLIDGRRSQYRIEGQESMGNGQSGTTGRAAAVLHDGTGARIALPQRDLRVEELFAGESAAFSFDALGTEVRQELGRCFKP